jgi:RimJ/RimL family protein N-acetyltransferase
MGELMHFSRKDRDRLLKTALDLTGSQGWRADAMVWGVFDTPEGDLKAVAVFQNIDTHGAEFHFGMAPGRRLTPGIVKSLIVMATHHRGMNLPRLFAHIAADNIAAQAAALKCGATFEYRIRGGLRDGKDVIVMALDRGDAGQRPADVETRTATGGE